jgi:hypothetical protein
MTKFKQETSGSKPFLWTREEWDENVEKTMVNTKTGKVKIDSEMVILKACSVWMWVFDNVSIEVRVIHV